MLSVALEQCRKKRNHHRGISCNPDSPVACYDFPIEVVVGPEFVTGSTRMKSSLHETFLNMISTTVMIQLGRVEDNEMVNMQLTNDKLVDRGTKMLMEKNKDYRLWQSQTTVIETWRCKKAGWFSCFLIFISGICTVYCKHQFNTWWIFFSYYFWWSSQPPYYNSALAEYITILYIGLTKSFHPVKEPFFNKFILSFNQYTCRY